MDKKNVQNQKGHVKTDLYFFPKSPSQHNDVNIKKHKAIIIP
jgi:hypothetical protein